MEIVEARSAELSRMNRTPGEAIEAFLASLDVSASSRATYTRSLKQFIGWLYETGRLSLELQREDILAYKAYLADTKAAYTVTLYLTAVRRLYQWLESQRVYPDITRGIKGAKKPAGFRKDILTKSQLREALETMEKQSLEGLRDYAIFNLLARTGLRTIEVSRALVGDIRQEAGEVLLDVQGKGRDSKDEFVVVTKEALKPIRQYLQARGEVAEDEPLFCSHSDRNSGEALTTRSISRIVKQALRSIGLDSKRLTAHSLRHTAITLAVTGGASKEQAQAMARHKDQRTTDTYFHNLQRIEKAAEKHITF